MRTYAVVLTGLILSACAHHDADASASPSPDPSPSPLRSCEIRTLTLDGAELVVQANADDSVASIVVVHAPDDAAKARADQDARKIFGDPTPDTRTQTQPFKDGLTRLTDMCGRPVTPSPSPAQ